MKPNQTQINIPSDWQLVKLGDICDFKKGKGLPKDDITADGKYDAIHYGELFTKYHEKIENILSKTNNNKNAFLSKKNDILMPTSDVTPRGLSTASFINKDGIILGGDILVIRPKSNILHGLFFSNFVSSQKKEVMKLVSGTTVFHLYGSDIAKLRFFLPPINEQNRIVSVLETWDKAIEKLSKKLEIKKQIKKGLMQDLLTGKKRLMGFSDDWEVKALKDLASVSKGRQLNIENMYGGDYPVINGGITESGYTGTKNTEKNTITISEGGNSCGFVNYISRDFWLGGHCYAVREREIIDKIFLYFLLKLNELRIMSLRVGSGLPNIQLKSLNSFKFYIPQSKKEQTAIAKILTTADREINIVENKLKIIKEQKRYLLNNLITGKIRTPETLSRKLIK